MTLRTAAGRPGGGQQPAGSSPAARTTRTGLASAASTAWWDRALTSYYAILGATGLLVVLGLVMVLSASNVRSYVDYGSSFWIFRKQLLWVALGLLAFWLGLRLRPRTYRRLAYPLLLVAIALLVVVLVPGIGTTVRGSTRWLDLGVFWLQPSEVAKLALALWGADLLVRKQALLTRWTHLLVPLLPVAMIMMALVIVEPDLGSTLCLVIVVFALLFFVGAPLRLFGMLATVMVTFVTVLIIVEPYRRSRFTGFLHPFSDPDHTGFQAVQGIYALANGGWWGVGLGGSSGKWNVPNAYTDYIFAIIGEELGVMGCIVVLALFAALSFAGLRVARRTADPFTALAAGAVTTWLVGQALINIGYVVGLLPVTGIPLPFISHGGTSLILALFVAGMLASFARSEPAAAAVLLNRPPTRWARLLRLPAPDPPAPARPSRVRRPAAGSRPASNRLGRGGRR